MLFSNLDQNVVDINNNQSHKNSARRRISLELKNKIIAQHEQANSNGLFQSIAQTSRETGFDRRQISRWLKQKDQIKDNRYQRCSFKVKSPEEKCFFPEMENKLHEWLVSKRRNENACISGLVIQQKAIEIFKEVYAGKSQGQIDFKASDGWKYNFLSRKNLVLRRITTTGRDLPRDALNTIRTFMNHCQVMRDMSNYSREIVLNADETTIYLDSPSNYTYDEKGQRRVKAATCGAERTRLSAMFTATASGKKLPIYIIVPRMTDLPDYVPPDNVKLFYKTGATFDQDVICDYLTRVVQPYATENSLEPILFIDSARCHLTKQVDAKFREIHTGKYIIPPRLTNLLQPADIAWFKTIKGAYSSAWNNWYLYEDKTYTIHGNISRPAMFGV